MKKFLVFPLVALALAACGGGKTESTASDSTAVETVDTTAVTANSYAGVIPAADGPGIEVTLDLKSDMSFVEKNLYLEADNESNEFVEEGTYTLDGEKLVLSYTTSPEVKQALLQGDSIQLLDSEGNLPTLPYVLKLKK